MSASSSTTIERQERTATSSAEIEESSTPLGSALHQPVLNLLPHVSDPGLILLLLDMERNSRLKKAITLREQVEKLDTDRVLIFEEIRRLVRN